MKQKTNLSSKSEAYSIIESSIRLTSVNPASVSSFLEDLLLSVPLLVRDGNEFRFVHKSIGDYFTGEYFAFSLGTDEIIEKIQNSYIARSFNKSLEFLADLNPSLFMRSVVVPLAKQALMEKGNSSDPVLRTLLFLGDLALRIEPGSKHVKAETIARSLSENIMEVGGAYIIIGKREFQLFGMKFAPSLSIPWPAWMLLTKDLSGDTSKLPKVPKKFTKVLELRKNYTLKSDYIIQHADNSTLKYMLVETLRLMAPWSGNPEPIRVLDDDACRSVLSSIQKEQETQSWVSSLLDK